MANPRREARRALAIGLAPSALLLATFAATGILDPGPAFLLGAVAAGGTALMAMRLPRPEPKPRNEAPPAPPVTADELLEPLPDPVLIVNRRRGVVVANRAARDLLGIGARGRHLSQSLRHPAVLAAVETLAAGVPSLTEEIDLPVPVPRTFTLHAARLRDADDPEAPSIVLSFHDETRARRAEQTRADFVANASHELRSPLSAVIGFIETLRGPARDDPEARERFLEIMHLEARRMARLIDDLMSLSRVEINEHVPPRAAVRVDQVLENVAKSLEGRASAKAMTIELEVPDGLPAVTGDADQLTQVFHNLVDNSIKYGGAGTPIRIAVARMARFPGTDGPGLAITVSDRGDGIPAVHLPRITERFYRVDEGRSRKLGGTGLGLAIVKHIVIRHRGQLRVESREGEGSAFTVQLPAAGTAPAGPPGAAAGGALS